MDFCCGCENILCRDSLHIIFELGACCEHLAFSEYISLEMTGETVPQDLHKAGCLPGTPGPPSEVYQS